MRDTTGARLLCVALKAPQTIAEELVEMAVNSLRPAAESRRDQIHKFHFYIWSRVIDERNSRQFISVLALKIISLNIHRYPSDLTISRPSLFSDLGFLAINQG
jgi:hypothetical protein